MKGAVGTPTTGHSLFVNIPHWKEVREMIQHLRRFDSSDIAKERLKIISYYQKYGERATKEAFGVDRKLIYTWRRRIRTRGNHIAALRPDSTSPKNTRKMMIDYKTLEYIRTLRESHYRLGKAKIKPLLDRYCKKENLPTLSQAKIGRIIKRYSLFYQKQTKIYHNPDSGYARRKKTKRKRVKYAPKCKHLGYVQMDTLVKFTDGARYYLYSAIDIHGKFALSLPYKRANARNTLDFFKKLELVIPYQITSVQTDNGPEFLGDFEQYLKQKKIKHFFIYPRCPRINGVIERYQRSLKEEFLNPNLHLICYPKAFSDRLAQYLIFYNTQRVHQSLNYETPVDYLIKKGGMSKMYRARTDT
jgi:transposase InsO family protein